MEEKLLSPRDEEDARPPPTATSTPAVARRAHAALVALILVATALMLFADASFPLSASTTRSETTSTSAAELDLDPRAKSVAHRVALLSPKGDDGDGGEQRVTQIDPPSCLSASCMHFVGGGAQRPRGAFPQPRQRSPRCWPSVEAYFRRGTYDGDVAEAVGDAREALRFYSRPSRDLLLVFDIDETSLSNAEEWLGDESSPGNLGTFLEDPLLALERRALKASSPPLRPTLDLYTDAFAAGFSVAFVTGRVDRGGMREATASNLREAGYGEQCGGGGRALDDEATPCYVALAMRDESDARPASVYKPEKRAELVEKNFTIVASLGDQFSDLAGLVQARASFKLPNPVYAIL